MNKIITTTEIHTFSIDNQMIIADCISKVLIPPKATDIKVVFNVPGGGGDWSNMAININKNCPITISYKIMTEKAVTLAP